MTRGTADWFFYGTLQDPELLTRVIGRDLSAHEIETRPARLPDFAARRALGEDFPLLVAAPGAVAEGRLVSGLDAEALARIAFFEGDDYRPGPVRPFATDGTRVDAHAFLPTGLLADSGQAWSLDHWTPASRALMRDSAAELMRYFGRRDAATLDAWWPDIKGRARRRAAETGAASPPLLREAIHRARGTRGPIAAMDAGRFAVERFEARHPRFSGGAEMVAPHAVARTGAAVAVLPYDLARDAVLLIEQWRPGPFAAGAAQPWLVEAIAGKIEPGEAAEAAARREAQEEGGVALGRLARAQDVWSLPGASDERIAIFIAEAELDPDAAAGSAGADADEDIRPVIVPFETALEALAAGEVDAAPAVIALLWLARNQDRLRLDWAGGA